MNRSGDSTLAATALVRKLTSLGSLSDEEREAVLALPIHVREVESGHFIVREGDRPSHCCVVFEGFTCRSKLTEDGGRQIMSFHIAGDLPDLQSLHLDEMDHNLSTLTPCKLGYISHADLRSFCAHWPRLAGLLWRDTLIDAAIFREWMLGMGRREAYVRIAHLLCELITKLRAVGLASGSTTVLPITQSELADALGLTDVHVNRTLKELKREGLFTWKGRTIVVNDWEKLKQAGEFNPSYLHMRPAEREARQPASPGLPAWARDNAEKQAYEC